MPAYRRQIAYILVLALLLMGCGLYAAYWNMQKTILRPDDGFFSLNAREGGWHLKLLGLDLVMNKKDLSLELFIKRIIRWGQENVDKLRQFR